MIDRNRFCRTAVVLGVLMLSALACAEDVIVPCTVEGTVVWEGANATLRVGEMMKVRTMVRTCGGRVYDLREYRYRSSDPTVAVVDSMTGWIYAWRSGRTTIASYEPRFYPGISGAHVLTVTP